MHRVTAPRRPTDRQLELVRLVYNRIRTKGSAPTVREIGDELQIKSTNAVNDMIRACEHKGLVAREPFKGRTLHLTTAGRIAIHEECCPCSGCTCACHERGAARDGCKPGITHLPDGGRQEPIQLRTWGNRLHLVVGGVVVASEGYPCRDAALLDEMGMDSTHEHLWTPQLLRHVTNRFAAMENGTS